ncbi:MAG: UbiA prenyltransferase family protein [Nitrososphaerota archaeon]|nr:UbiA prenyltransferase family protein [Nitrososphaerota archaeon]
MGPVRPWVSLVRFEEYGPLFLLCGFVGALYAGLASMAGLLGLLSFIGFFSASAFVLNDVTDWREDSAAPGARNPISTGELSLRTGVAAFCVLAAASAVSLAFVGTRALAAAPLAYALYWGYSVGPKWKSRPVADIVVHGSVPALFVFMGYSLSRQPSPGVLALSGAVFCFAAMSGLLQEVRDLDKDASTRKTTASLLGKAASSDAALALLGAGLILFVVASLSGAMPPAMAALTPAAYVVAAPLLALRRGRADAGEAIAAIRARGLVLAVLAVAAYALVAAA